MNVKADEYVAACGVLEEGKTPAEANTKMDATIVGFKASLKSLGVNEGDLFVDFVIQNRIYAYRLEEALAREELVGFELKKNVSIHFKDRLQAQTAGIIRYKAERYQKLLGVKLPGPAQVVVDRPSVYYPVEQYASYTAAEPENMSLPYDRSRYTVQNARKSRTTYFNPLSGDGFDVVLNPVIIEPVVQFTTYLKVKYETGNKQRK